MDFFNSSDFDTEVHRLATEFHAPGLVISFIQDDKVNSKAYGVTSVDSAVWCHTDTLFDIGSCSHCFIAAAVGILVEDNENYPDIQWCTPMKDLLQGDFVMQGYKYTEGITLEDILSHRTGLPSHERSCLAKDTPAIVTQNLRNLSINAPLRSKYQRCDIMYTVAIHLIQTHTKTSFADFLRQHLLKPLGMKSTHLNPLRVKSVGTDSLLMTPHFYRNSTSSYTAFHWPINPESQYVGSICTTVNDMPLFVRALINKIPPLSSSLVKALLTPRIITESFTYNFDPLDPCHSFGFGWHIESYYGYQIVSHYNFDDDFPGIVFFLPALKIGGTIMSNNWTASYACYAIRGLLINACLPQLSPLEKRNWSLEVRHIGERYKSDCDRHSADLRQRLLRLSRVRPNPERHTTPLETYVGTYYSTGYHMLTVQIKDGTLFVDGTDRKNGFTLTFEHMHGQTCFLVNPVTCAGGGLWRKFEGKFTINGNGECCRLRLGLEMEDLIWFVKSDTN